MADTMPGGEFCENCRDVQLDDTVFNGVVSSLQDESIFLKRDSTDPNEMHRELACRDDVLPALPILQHSYRITGCRMCQYLHQVITQLNIPFSTPEITIALHYQWFTWPESAHQKHEQLMELVVYIEGAGILDRTLFFKVETDNKVVGTWLGLPKCPKPLPWCQENTTWVQKILESSDRLQLFSYGIPFDLPSRLIDLGDDPRSYPRLVTGFQAERTHVRCHDAWARKYCALSYCWGSETDSDSNEMIRTTRDTFDAISQGLPLTRFPRAVRDAITVCRSLRVRFLWVDSLCILQDDKEDWENEVRQLTKTYSNAYLTICAASSASAQHTFLEHPQQLTLDVDFQSTIDPYIKGDFRLTYRGTDCPQSIPLRDLHCDLDCAWSRRDWTFQESEVTPRKLFFGNNMLYFQDRRRLYHENGRILSSLSTDLALPIKGNRLLHQLLDAWSHRLKSFTSTSLKFNKERLTAIIDLASEFSKRDPGPYLNKTWQKDLLFGLLWGSLMPSMELQHENLLKHLTEPDRFTSPSWSFLSRIGAVDDGASPLLPPKIEQHFRSEAIFSRDKTCPTDQEVFGQIQGGRVVVYAKARPVPELYLTPWENLSTQIWTTCIDGQYNATCYLDWAACDGAEDRDGLQLLLLGSSCEQDPYADGGQAFSFEDDLDDDVKHEHSSAYDPRENDPDFCLCYNTGPGLCASHKWCRICNHCERCCPEEPQHNRAAWGIIIHPALDGPGYRRVGVFTSRVRDQGQVSGTKMFENAIPDLFELI